MCINEDYKFAYCLWYKYFMKCEIFDRLITPNGIPKTIEHRIIMNRNSSKIREELGISIVSAKEWNGAKEHALRDVERKLKEED